MKRVSFYEPQILHHTQDYFIWCVRHWGSSWKFIPILFFFFLYSNDFWSIDRDRFCLAFFFCVLSSSFWKYSPYSLQIQTLNCMRHTTSGVKSWAVLIVCDSSSIPNECYFAPSSTKNLTLTCIAFLQLPRRSYKLSGIVLKSIWWLDCILSNVYKYIIAKWTFH